MIEQTNESRSLNAGMLTPPRWMEAQSLDLAYQLNEHFLELMSQANASADSAGVLAQLRVDCNLWSSLDAEARKRAARFPFAMADVRFMGIAWWRRVTGLDNEPVPTETDSVCLPPHIGEQLILDTLMFAWYAAHSNVETASVTVGMAPDVAVILSRLSAHEIRRIAAEHSGVIGPRWRNMPELWEKWLVTARNGNDKALSMIHLHAKLLLCGELRSACN